MEKLWITFGEAQKCIQSGSAIYIDLRTKDAYERGHLKGAASIPYPCFEENMKWLDREITMIFYCDHGGKSLKLAKDLSEQGWDAYSLIGGYDGNKSSCD